VLDFPHIGTSFLALQDRFESVFGGHLQLQRVEDLALHGVDFREAAGRRIAALSAPTVYGGDNYSDAGGPETVTLGTNELIGTDPAALKPALDRLFAGQWKKGAIPERWDGHAGERIAEVLKRLLS